MNSNEMLKSGAALTSSNKKATLTLDSHCNLEVKYDGKTKTYLERSSTQVTGPCFLKINKKGTLLLVSSNFKVSVIARAKDQKATYYQLALTDHGFLKLYAVNKAWELAVKPKPKKVYIDEDKYLQAPTIPETDEVDENISE
jgi:hypothetical protein